MLQQTKAMKMIARKIVRKIIQMMGEIAERSKDTDEDEDPYLTFYRDFGHQIKIGCIEDRDNRKKLMRLLRFNTTQHEEYPISLDEYVANMKPEQKEIFYIAGDPITTTITKSPFLIPYKKKDIDVIFFPESIDEALAAETRAYDGKPFTCITQSDKNKAESEREKKRVAEWKKEFRPLTNWFKRLLKGNVTRVEISARLAVDTRSPCVLSSAEGSVSPQLAKVIRAQEEQSNRKASYEEKRVFEINPRSDLIIRLNTALAEAKDKADHDKLEKLGRMMFETAMIDNGYAIEDPTVYADHVFEIMTKMTGLPHAPVLPDDILFDFDRAAEQEAEEERAALREEKKEKRKKAREEKRRLARLKRERAEEGLEDEDETAEPEEREEEETPRRRRRREREEEENIEAEQVDVEEEPKEEGEEQTSEGGESQEGGEEDEFPEDVPMDEQEELFNVLDEGAGPQKSNPAYFKELFVEDVDDKRDRLLAERKQQRQDKAKRMEKSKKKKEMDRQRRKKVGLE
jgi:hypothetical protein